MWRNAIKRIEIMRNAMVLEGRQTNCTVLECNVPGELPMKRFKSPADAEDSGWLSHSTTIWCCPMCREDHPGVHGLEESDPNGVGQHEPGAKLDAGKVRAGVLGQFSRALLAVAEVGTHGAEKYSRGGWQTVENGIERYGDAGWRHKLKGAYEDLDPDSNLKHKAHEAWNILAELELILREENK
jgi:hypothetical protein